MLMSAFCRCRLSKPAYFSGPFQRQGFTWRPWKKDENRPHYENRDSSCHLSRNQSRSLKVGCGARVVIGVLFSFLCIRSKRPLLRQHFSVSEFDGDFPVSTCEIVIPSLVQAHVALVRGMPVRSKAHVHI